MRVNLKDLHTVRVELATGEIKAYHYAWRGGPRVEGELGTPEFMANYNVAIEKVKPPSGGTVRDLSRAFQLSTEFTQDIGDRSREDYVRHLKAIEEKYGDFPLKAMATPATRGDFLEWRDTLANKSTLGLRQIDLRFVTFARMLSWGKDRGKIGYHPLQNIGRLYNNTRADIIWSEEQEEAFLTNAPAHLHLPLLLALWTGQRQGDLLVLPWSAYNGETIRLTQRKSMKKKKKKLVRVEIPVGAPLKAMLDAAPRKSPVILLTTEGTVWTSEGFRASWGTACKKAGINGVTFNDLRGTAVTRLAMVGCTEIEIATITGHSVADVRSILDRHYLNRNIEIARNAIHKLELKYAGQKA